MTPDERIQDLNLILPEPIKLPPNVDINFSWVRVSGERVFVSTHIALNPDGSIYDVVGKVGAELPFGAAVEIEAEIEIST